MSDIDKWTTNAAGNNAAPPDGWPEGMSPADVNDAAREMMAAVRRWYNTAEWSKFGDGSGDYTICRSTTNIFEVEGADVTGRYCPNQRIKVIGALTGTVYGTIVTSTFSTNTKVTVNLDDVGDELSDETLSVYLSTLRTPLRSLPPTYPAILWAGTADYGGGKTLSLSLRSALTTLTAGVEVMFKSHATTNTGSCKLLFSSLPLTDLKTADGSQLSAGQLRPSTVHKAVYDGTDWLLVGTYNSAGQVSSGNFTSLSASEVSFVTAQATSLSASEARFINVSASNVYAGFVSATSLSASEASIESLSVSNLVAENAQIASLSAVIGNFGTSLSAAAAYIGAVRGVSLSFSSGKFDSLSVSSFVFGRAFGNRLDVDSLSASEIVVQGADSRINASSISATHINAHSISASYLLVTTGAFTSLGATVFNATTIDSTDVHANSISASHMRWVTGNGSSLCVASDIRCDRIQALNAQIQSLSASNVKFTTLSVVNEITANSIWATTYFKSDFVYGTCGRIGSLSCTVLNVVSLSAQNASAFGGSAFTNKIVNPKFEVWDIQQGGSNTISYTRTWSNNNLMLATDWWGYQSGAAGVLVVAPDTELTAPGVYHNIRFQADTESAISPTSQYRAFEHPIEGYYVVHANFGTGSPKGLAYQMYIKSAIPGIYCVAFRNDDSNRSYVHPMTVCETGTWMYFEHAFTADTAGSWGRDNNIGVKLAISGFCGSDYHVTTCNTWTTGNFMGVSGMVQNLASSSASYHYAHCQLEVNAASPGNFEHRPYQQERALCDRYYYVIEQYADRSWFAGGRTQSLYVVANITIPFRNKMRDAPSVTIGSNWTQSECCVSNVTFVNISKDAATMLVNYDVNDAIWYGFLREATIFVDAGLL